MYNSASFVLQKEQLSSVYFDVIKYEYLVKSGKFEESI